MLALFSALSFSVPKRYPGMIYGATNYKVLIDLYCDPLCSDCATAWPTIKKVLDKYQKDIQIRFHTIPLEIHTWSYHSVRAVQALRMINEDYAKKMIDELYDGDQIQFLNTAMMDTSERGCNQKFCDYVAKKWPVNATQYCDLYQSMDSRRAAGAESVLALTHVIMGTPSFEINGVLNPDLNEDTTFSQWVEYLDSLLN